MKRKEGVLGVTQDLIVATTVLIVGGAILGGSLWLFVFVWLALLKLLGY